MTSPEPDDGNIFDDEEAVCGMLKSLISTTGLQSSQKGVSKRLQVLEEELREARSALAGTQQRYALQAEFLDARRTQDLQLQLQGGSLSRLEETVARLAGEVKGLVQTREESAARFDAIDSWMELAKPVVSDVLGYVEQIRADVRNELEAARSNFGDLFEKSAKDFTGLQSQADTQISLFGEELKAVEERMREFARCEIQRATEEWSNLEFPAEALEETPQPHLRRSSSKTAPVKPVKPLSQQQRSMLDFATKATNPLRAALSKVTERLSGLGDELVRQREDLARQQQQTTKATADLSTQLRETEDHLQQDIETRALQTTCSDEFASISQTFETLQSDVDTLREQVVQKLNAFRDHFAKVGEVVDDHEHCLRHHAEELENRSSKYDVLLCQHQLDRCARKEETVREVQEIRKVLNWQSSKIESLALLTSGLSGTGSSQKRRGAKKLKGHGKQGLETRSHSEDGESSPTTPALAQGDLREDMVETVAEEEPLEEGTLKLPVRNSGHESPRRSVVEEAPAKVNAGDEDDTFDDGDEDEEDESSDEELGGAGLVRQQLEAVTYGLVGLGNLTLREPKLGMGRDARLRREQDLLDELSNLRHWVSSRMLPSGWDPAKITTAALACSHPRGDELKRPLPQVSLKAAGQDRSPRQLVQPQLVPRPPPGGRSKASAGYGAGDLAHTAPLPARALALGGSASRLSTAVPAA